MSRREKLNTFDCVGNAYSALFENFGAALFIVTGWGVLGVAIFYGWLAVLPILFGTFPYLLALFRETPEEAQGVVVLAPVALVVLAGSISIVVAWHRLIIRHDTPKGPFPTGFSSIVAYAWRLLCVIAPPFVLLFVLASAVFFFSPGDVEVRKKFAPVVLIVVVPLVLAVALLFVRLCVALPAAAIGARTIGVMRAWQLTRGNSWRLFWGTFLATLPFNFISRICEKILDDVPSMSGTPWAAVVLITMVVVDVLGYVVTVGFFSFAYLHFVSGTEVEPTDYIVQAPPAFER